MLKRVPLFLGLVSVVGLFLLLRTPVRATGLRIGILTTSLFPILIAILVLWRRKHLGKALLALLLAAAGWAAATASLAEPSAEKFTAALGRYEGTPYVWGGETRRGIDCSGLIRMALRDAYLSAGRPGAALRIWWKDAAARDFASAYGDLLLPTGEAPSIGGMERGRLPPGCIAVTADGVHVLARLPDDRWIQASPAEGQVIIRPATSPDPWHRCPVVLYRLR